MVVYFNEFIERLHKSNALEDYALRSGTSSQYLFTHLKHRRKIPSKSFMQILALETRGEISFRELVLWFYDLDSDVSVGDGDE